MDDGKSKKGVSADPINELHTAVSVGVEIAKDKNSNSSGGKSVETVEGPIGVDMGTSRVVVYGKEGLKFVKNVELNAFYAVPSSAFTENILKHNKLLHYRHNSSIYVIGNGAVDFANISNGEIRRPMASGLLNPREEAGTYIIEELIHSLIKKPKSLGEKLCFSVPAAIRGASFNPVFHEGIIKNLFVSMGYMAKGVNEGYMVVLSALEKDNFTGIGISCGGGLCNICLSYMSVPVITFSINKAGDYIDKAAGDAVGEHANRVRVIKEESLNLLAEPRDRVEKALHIYYEELILSLIQNIKEAMEESDHMPKINKSIPIVLGGGTVKPEGFRDKFDNILRESEFPIPISDVRMAEEPLFAVAKGAYMAACAEEEEG